jgi:hypothetical protein
MLEIAVSAAAKSPVIGVIHSRRSGKLPGAFANLETWNLHPRKEIRRGYRAAIARCRLQSVGAAGIRH